ncbi:MAG: glycosyltransferase family protein, partial [Candidatus Nitrosotenuis sp.]
MIGCIIQARLGSSRLPEKIMQKIDDHNTVLDYVVKQVRAAKKIEKILVATTNLEQDDVICDHLATKNIECCRGSSEDVLDRYYQCAKKFSVDTIVRITADNPLVDPNIIDLIIDKYVAHNCDLSTNTLHRTFPYGTEVEVFSFTALEQAWKQAKKPSEREHVTPFIRDPQNKFNLINVEYEEDLSYLRYTIDRMEDLSLVKEIVRNIQTRPILIQNIINLYKTKPSIFEIN